ncbi:MAG: winged helix DNA-binding domain-containing protein [Rhodospirillales bacterium]|nr:winged helix DNA-binding domain-containing protein [Rhodospirillales bacterium]
MRTVTRAELARFLLRAQGLLGPLAPREQAAETVARLGMVQIDSIRSTGLRNQDLAWLARADGEPGDLARAAYGERRFLESHYPIHLVRRDLVPLLITNYWAMRRRHAPRRHALAREIRRLRALIRDRGPVMPRDLRSRRIDGGFDTVKATTQALELLYYGGELMVAGRSRNFDRLFDLTERVAPELAGWERPRTADYERFLVASALEVLKAATRDQLIARLRHHRGSWQKPALAPERARRIVDRYLGSGEAEAVKVRDLGEDAVYWYSAREAALWEEVDDADPILRLIPPLDTLVASRRRLKALFDLDFLFEAYKPAVERRFYFALPMVHDGTIAGILDARLADGAWRIDALELRRPLPAEALRAGLHRIARLAGARRVEPGREIDRRAARILAGSVEPF